MEQLLIHSVAAFILSYNNSSRMPFDDFKNFTEWLGCYDSIYPMYRDIDFDLLAYLVKGCAQLKNNKTKATKVFQAWVLSDLIETVLNIRQQRILLQILMEKQYANK
jgi:hypothetical protein